MATSKKKSSLLAKSKKKSKNVTDRIKRVIEERMVFSPESLMKLSAWGAGAYFIHEYYGYSKIITEKMLPWGVFGLAGLGVGALLKFGITEEEIKKNKLPTTPQSIAMSLLSSYLLVEHGKDLFGLGKLLLIPG